MKKYFLDLFNLKNGASRTHWWVIAIPTFVPWLLLGPAIFVSILFAPLFLLSALTFLLGVVLLPLFFLLILVSLYVFIHILYVLVSIKRYRDLGMSPLWFLVVFVPVVGIIIQIVQLGFLKGRDQEVAE
jgi:uncharacterized membrane protein YhaH (DUF805 family)